jgi:hypothetical protein
MSTAACVIVYFNRSFLQNFDGFSRNVNNLVAPPELAEKLTTLFTCPFYSDFLIGGGE